MSEQFTVREINWERINLTITVEVAGYLSGQTHEAGSNSKDNPPDLRSQPLTPQLEAASGPTAIILPDQRIIVESHDKPQFLLWSPGSKAFSVDAHDRGNGLFDLVINVTNFQQRAQVPNGTRRLLLLDKGEFHTATIDLAAVPGLDEKSRNFIYNRALSVYTVSFGITDDEADIAFLIRTYSFGRKDGGGNTAGLLGRTKQKLVSRWSRIKRKTLIRIYRASLRWHSDRSAHILFASEARLSMQGNLKSVHDRMKERGLDGKFEFHYSFRTHQTTSRSTAFKLAWLLGRCDTIIIDDYFGLLESLPVSGHHRIIQLWHAGSGFKSIGYSRFGNYGSPRLTNSHREYTYAIAGSDYLRHVYAEAFGIEETAVIPTGLPRIDQFLDDSRLDVVRDEVYRAFPQAVGKKIALFAPTFRGRGVADARYDYSAFDFARLHRALGDDSVLLIRQHHFIQDPAPIPAEVSDRILDATAYPDSNDLLRMTDILITDYSSIFYEYSLLGRPMIFFAPDLEAYSATRGMHRDYEETAPGTVARTFEELIDALAHPEAESEKRHRFVAENFNYQDTGNSDRVIDWLILDQLPEKLSPRTSGDTP